MKLATHMYGHIHPHMGLPKISNKDLKISMRKYELLANSGKLRTYKLIKHEFKMEKYLSLPPHLRVPTARLRTSAHSLRIETGRYNLPAPVPADKRYCWFCTNQLVEDELHFLFDCDLYKLMPEKDKLMEHCKNLNRAFPFMSNLDKWNYISSSEQKEVIFLFSKFVSIALETRRNSLDHA